MNREQFLNHAEQLREFVLASIEEFLEHSGYPFDPVLFLANSSTDFDQMAIEAMVFGGEGYEEEAEPQRRVA